MKLWAREKRVSKSKQAGIRKGEEIMNHYTDIELPVQERREWAAGSLGGHCMCERCCTESSIAGVTTWTNGDVVMSNGV